MANIETKLKKWLEDEMRASREVITEYTSEQRPKCEDGSDDFVEGQFDLAQRLNKNEWLEFFNLFLSINDMEKEVFEIEIKNFKNTKDSDLLKLVNIIENVNQ